MLTCWSEACGITADHCIIERAHLFAIERFLNVSTRTPSSVYEETDICPLYVNTYTRCIHYWLNLERMPDMSSLCTHIHKMYWILAEPWKNGHILCMYSFTQDVLNIDWTLKECQTCSLYVHTYTRCIEYWLNLERMPDSHLLSKSYKILHNLHCKKYKQTNKQRCFMLAFQYGCGFV